MNNFYLMMISSFVVITVFGCASAVIGSFVHTRLFSGHTFLYVCLGSVLGTFIGTPLMNISREYGFLGIGLGIALVYVIVYTNAIRRLIELIPEGIRNAVRVAYQVIRVALIATLIIGITWVILAALN